MATQKRIKEKFRTPGHPTAFSAPHNVSKYYNISVNKAKNALQQTDSYVLHKEYKRPSQFNPYYVYNRRELVQADLIEIRGLSQTNDGINYLLLIIDVFSRKVHLYPLISKSAVDMCQALSSYFNDIGNPAPKMFMTDAGREFWNRSVQRLLQNYGVELKLAAGTSKACYAERANKTMQTLIYKYLTDRETTRYIDVLQDLVKTYNKRGHRSLQYMSPNNADKPRNENIVRDIAIQRFQKVKRKKPKLKLGDMVRIKTDPQKIDPGRRAYAEQYHGEYFTIVRINRILPIPMYYLKSMDTEEILEEGFYSNELSQVQGDVFKIDHILRERGRGPNKQVLVKWKYFGDRWNQWIPARDIVETY